MRKIISNGIIRKAKYLISAAALRFAHRARKPAPAHRALRALLRSARAAKSKSGGSGAYQYDIIGEGCGIMKSGALS